MLIERKVGHPIVCTDTVGNAILFMDTLEQQCPFVNCDTMFYVYKFLVMVVFRTSRNAL